MPDAPGHILTIPDSLGRDLDKAKEGKIAPPPMEAFMSDAALAEVERATKARSEPVHAENLHPITRGQADYSTRFDGENLPKAPQMRRVIPAPFQRPRIEAGTHGKSWQWVQATEVVLDDIVPDVGRVVTVQEHVIHKTVAEILGVNPEATPDELESMEWGPSQGIPDLGEKVAVGTVILLTGLGGEVKAFRTDQQVRVFRKSGG